MRDCECWRSDESRAMRISQCITLSGEHDGFDAKLAGGELWLAVALRRSTSEPESEDAVALFRVDGDGPAVELSRCRSLRERPDASLLPRRQSAGVRGHCGNTAWEVHELGIAIGGGRLEPRCVVLRCSSGDGEYPSSRLLCVTNDALIAWNFERPAHQLHSAQYNTEQNSARFSNCMDDSA